MIGLSNGPANLLLVSSESEEGGAIEGFDLPCPLEGTLAISGRRKDLVKPKVHNHELKSFSLPCTEDNTILVVVSVSSYRD